MVQDKGKEELPSRVDFSQLRGLPKPVEQYFKHVLSDGQPMIKVMEITQTGVLRTNTNSNKWLSFKATQSVRPCQKSFVWNAKVKLFPGIFISVEDKLEKAVGSGKVKLFNIIPIASDKNHIQLNAGALHRYLAEAV